MRVRVLGFSIDPTKKPTLNDVMQHIESKEQKALQNHNKNGGRFLFIDTKSHNEYHLGVVITAKSNRTFCRLKQQGSSFRVAVSDVGNNASIMDFNFFVINKKSGLGLYQYYHQSCSIKSMMDLLESGFNVCLEKERTALIKKLQSQGHEEKKAKVKANKQLQSRFSWQLLIRKENLRKILLNFKRIKSLEVNYSYIEPENTEFSPLSTFVTKQKKRFLFSNKNTINKLIDPLINVIKQVDPESGRVIAIDQEGIERPIDLYKNPDNFGEYDYDEVTSKLNDLEISQFSKSWMIGKLVQTCQKHTEIFEANVRS